MLYRPINNAHMENRKNNFAYTGRTSILVFVKRAVKTLYNKDSFEWHVHFPLYLSVLRAYYVSLRAYIGQPLPSSRNYK